MTAKTKFNPRKSNFPRLAITSVGGKLQAVALGTSMALLASLTPFLVPAASAYPNNQAKTLLRQAYCRVLERPVDDDGLIEYGKALRGDLTVRQLIYNLATSEEHKNRFYDDDNLRDSVGKLFDHLLARPADDGGLKSWRRVMREQGYEAVVRGKIVNQIPDSRQLIIAALILPAVRHYQE
jgi:Phycobilisome Linker polypeptide